MGLMPSNGTDGATRRVLVVEDDEASATLITFVLERAGFNVQRVATGEEAIKLATQEPFDLIFMDFILPGMDGPEATLNIRRNERMSGSAPTRIVGLTASDNPKDHQACLDAGMTEVMPKPFRVEELRAFAAEGAIASQARRISQ